MPSTITKPVTIRLPNIQAINLRCSPYKEHKAILIRLLLDAYFKGHLPSIKKEFEAEVSKSVQRTKLGKSVRTENKIAAGKDIGIWIQKQLAQKKQQQVQAQKQSQLQTEMQSTPLMKNQK